MGMFEDTLIPNDLKNVCDIIDAYYAEDLEEAVSEAPVPAKKSK